MESIGDKLRTARLQASISLEQAARDTHISKRYLDGMESEDFDIFPGETYLLGFLRTYAEYLSLDPREIANLYKNLKLQEQPAPLDELIVRKSRKPLVLSLVIILGVAGLGVGAYFLFTSGVLDAPPPVTDEPEDEIVQEYEFTGQSLETSFQAGEAVRVPTEEGTVLVIFRRIDEEVTMEVPTGVFALSQAGERLVDLTNDGRADLRIVVGSVAAGRAVIRLDRLETQGEDPAPETDELFANLGTTEEASRVRRPIVIRSVEEPVAYTVSILVTRTTFLRYQADAAETVERLYEEGAEIEIAASVSLYLSFADPGAVTVAVDGEPVDVGRPGSATSWLLAWRRAQDSDLELTLAPAY